MAAAKKEEKKPIMSCASSGHITKLKQTIFAPFDIYDCDGVCQSGSLSHKPNWTSTSMPKLWIASLRNGHDRGFKSFTIKTVPVTVSP